MSMLDERPRRHKPTVNLNDKDLRDADLKDTDLYGVDLCDVDLTGANLEGADLSRATLSNVRLVGAGRTREYAHGRRGYDEGRHGSR